MVTCHREKSPGVTAGVGALGHAHVGSALASDDSIGNEEERESEERKHKISKQDKNRSEAKMSICTSVILILKNNNCVNNNTNNKKPTDIQ